MRRFEIWLEGWRANGGSIPAIHIADRAGETFRDACVKIYDKDPNFDRERLTVWGCRLFDNGADARKLNG